MTLYNDYQNFLFSVNFVGGAGKGSVPLLSGSSDIRAEVGKDGTDFYQFYFAHLTSLTDFNALSYYDSPANDEDGMPV